MGNRASKKTTNALQERNTSEKEKYNAVVKKYRINYGSHAYYNKKYPEKGIYEDERVNPLMIAVEKNELEDVKILIAGGADVNEVAMDSHSRDDITPLMMAIQQQDYAYNLEGGPDDYNKVNIDIFRYLLDNGADPNIESFRPKGLNALHYAAWHHLPPEEIEVMVERMSIDSINKIDPRTKKTPLDLFYEAYRGEDGLRKSQRQLQRVIDFIRSKGGKSNFYKLDGSLSLPGFMGKETNLLKL